MSTYKELLHKREELEQAIAYARKSELVAAIANVRGIIEEYDLSSEDIFGRGATKSRGPSKAKGQSVPPKYRDPATGATWTGRGKAPKWIQDKEREQFAIA